MSLDGNVIRIEFKNDAVPLEHRLRHDMSGLAERIRALGVSTILLDWKGVGSVSLPVDDDIDFLVDAYLELDDFARGGSVHHVYLADGLLEVVTAVLGECVHVCVRHAPGLRKECMRLHETTSSLRSYMAGWDAMMLQLRTQSTT